jgi:uncharacterized damage-inducible protein DinB
MQQITHLLAHMEWANQRVLDLFKQLPEIPDRPQGLFSHLLIAERLWLLRLRDEDTSNAEVWPDYSLAELDQLASANQAGYRMFLEKIDEAGGLEELVSYKTTTGEGYETRVRDILTHVALHGGYHRGQIAAVLREGGVEPVNTDFVTFTRQ